MDSILLHSGADKNNMGNASLSHFGSPQRWQLILCQIFAVPFFFSCSGGGGGSGGGSPLSSSTNNTCPTTLALTNLGSTGIAVDPGPGSYAGTGIAASTVYSVQVQALDGSGWQTSTTYRYSRSSVTQWHNGTSPTTHFSSFALASSTQVKVTLLTGNITSISVYPSSLNITPTISGATATFSLSQTNKVWLIINNNDAAPLFVYADPPKPIAPSSGNYVYYGPGVHHLPTTTTINSNTYYTLQATSNEIIYLDAGAIVIGNINVGNTTGVQILGPGILSGEFTTGTLNAALTWTQQLINSVMITSAYGSGSTNGPYNDQATVCGITIVNSPFYNFWGAAQYVNGIKEISPWFYSTDGFEYVANINNVFAFVGDNVFFPSHAGTYGGGTQNFIASNSLVGCTNDAVFNGGFWGNPNSASYGYSSTMSNISIMSYTNGNHTVSGTHTPAIFQLWVDNSSDNGAVGNYGNSSNGSTFGLANQTYSNITVENNTATGVSLSSNIAELINFCYPTGWNGSDTCTNGPLGNSYNLTFQNITIKGSSNYSPASGDPSLSEIQGLNSSNEFYNVTWTNLYINGTHVTNSNYSTYFNVNSWINNLIFQ